MKQLSIAIGLIKLLNNHKKIDSNIVAKEFNVSIRTAQRYLTELSCSFPVYTEEGERNKLEYSLMEKVNIENSLLNNEESFIISALLDYAKSVLSEDNEKVLDIIKNKIFHVSSNYQPYFIMDKKALDFKKIAKVSSSLKKYIQEKRIINIYYERTKKNYTLEPYKMIYWSGFWYLLGKHEENVKKFVLDYIKQIKPSRNFYDKIPENFEKQLKGSDNIWFDDKTEEVEVKIDKFIANYFKRKNILRSQKIIKENKNKTLFLKFCVSNEKDLFHQIIPWIPYVKIIKPKKYKDFLNKELSKAIKFNK
jgi:predicted DNA-binding transcriptional regulator YafY